MCVVGGMLRTEGCQPIYREIIPHFCGSATSAQLMMTSACDWSIFKRIFNSFNSTYLPTSTLAQRCELESLRYGHIIHVSVSVHEMRAEKG